MRYFAACAAAQVLRGFWWGSNSGGAKERLSFGVFHGRQDPAVLGGGMQQRARQGRHCMSMELIPVTLTAYGVGRLQRGGIVQGIHPRLLAGRGSIGRQKTGTGQERSRIVLKGHGCIDEAHVVHALRALLRRACHVDHRWGTGGRLWHVNATGVDTSHNTVARHWTSLLA